jgi:hypothetical protein
MAIDSGNWQWQLAIDSGSGSMSVCQSHPTSHAAHLPITLSPATPCWIAMPGSHATPLSMAVAVALSMAVAVALAVAVGLTVAVCVAVVRCHPPPRPHGTCQASPQSLQTTLAPGPGGGSGWVAVAVAGWQWQWIGWQGGNVCVCLGFGSIAWHVVSVVVVCQIYT